jgi:hypothetical protein
LPWGVVEPQIIDNNYENTGAARSFTTAAVGLPFHCSWITIMLQQVAGILGLGGHSLRQQEDQPAISARWIDYTTGAIARSYIG